jgi:endonuclease/exonuclease/phosphatase (EEP) superfamily protein YafD
MLAEIHYPCPDGQASHQDRLKVLYWNVWYRVDSDVLIRAIENFNCDIVLLQELLLFSRGTCVPERIAKLGYSGFFAECRRFKGLREGTAIFSRFPMAMRCVELRRGGRLPLRGGAESRRCYVEATIESSHDPITFGIAHLSYFSIRAGLTREQETLFEELAGHQRRFIFGGDFNATPRSSIVTRLRKMDGLKNLGPDIRAPSWRPFPNRLSRVGRRLDYAFATPDLHASAQFGDQERSDHRPLIVTVNL